MGSVGKRIAPAPDGLYDQDYVLWLETQAALLRAGRFDALDIETLAEEIEAMAGRDRRELKSRLTILLMHLLKWHIQPAMRTGSWKGTIRTQRQEIDDILDQSPSLKRTVPALLLNVFPVAADLASDETGLPRNAFPTALPYTPEQVLDAGFLPGPADG